MPQRRPPLLLLLLQALAGSSPTVDLVMVAAQHTQVGHALCSHRETHWIGLGMQLAEWAAGVDVQACKRGAPHHACPSI